MNITPDDALVVNAAWTSAGSMLIKSPNNISSYATRMQSLHYFYFIIFVQSLAL